MKRYFTDLLICPRCFNPINFQLNSFELNEDIIRCDSCGNYFRKYIIVKNNYFDISFPMFTEIKLNSIESSYVEWIHSINGKFIVTWPWDEVRFTPILLHEYLHKFLDNRVVVFCNSKFIEYLKRDNTLNSLYSINIDDGIDYEYENLKIDDVFVKYDVDNPPIINDNINKSFNICFRNKFEIVSCFDNIKYCFIKSFDDLKNAENYQLFFIDESILSNELVGLLEDISPDLLISTDIDALYGKRRFRKGNPIYKLYKLDSYMLFFSINLIHRTSHNIGQKDYFLKNWNIIPHTWDYKIILNKIKDIDDDEISFFTSLFSEVHNYNMNFNIELIKCNPLKKIEDSFPLFEELFPYDLKSIGRTLNDLMKTPLYIKGLYNDKRVLDRNITFEYLFNLVYNIDYDKWVEVINIFDDVYGYNSIIKNPIIDSIIDLILNNNINYGELVIIVHSWDIRGTKLILNDKLGENNILITSWKDLDQKIFNTDIKYGISTLFPPIQYDVSLSSLEHLFIICSPNNFQRFEVYEKNRFTDNGLKPIYLLDENENAPLLLKTCLNDVNIPKEFYDKLNKIHELGFNYNKNIRLKEFNYDKLRKNINAVFVLNDLGQGMFLKFNNIIYIYNELNEIEDFEIEYGSYKNLVNKKMLINYNNEYHSLGRIFLKFVIDNGQNIPLSEDLFKWNGFKELIECMFEWVDLLHEIINKESSSSNNVDSIKNKLVKNLCNLDLTAKDEKYILNNWFDESQSLNTKFGEIKIYESERPKKEEDLLKIYGWISENYPEFQCTKLAAKKCFAASRLLNRIRNHYLDIKSSKLDDELNKFNVLFKSFLVDETKLFNKFNIVSVEKVKIKNEVRPFEIVNNPYFYIADD